MITGWDSSVWKLANNGHLDKNCWILVFLEFVDLHLQVLSISDQYVHCAIETTNGHCKGCVTFVYAHHYHEKRKQLWSDLLHLHSSMLLPWITVGDFNVVLDVTEKQSANGSISRVFDELQLLFVATDLHDLCYVGSKFTWDNGSTFCKLDRAICNTCGLIIILVPLLISCLKECLIILLSCSRFLNLDLSILLLSSLRICGWTMMVLFLW